MIYGFQARNFHEIHVINNVLNRIRKTGNVMYIIVHRMRKCILGLIGFLVVLYLYLEVG